MTEDTNDPLATESTDDDADGGRVPDLVADGSEALDTVGESARSAGAGIGMALVWPLKAGAVSAWKGGEGLLLGVTRVLPKGSGLWQRVITIGYKNLKRTSNADRIGHLQKQGNLLHRPLYWNNDRNRWETKSGANWWNGGKQHTYIGPGGVPCVWAASRATELGDQVQSEVAEALEVGATQDLYTDAEVTIQQLTLDAGADQAGGQGGAIADGGNPVMSTNVTVDHPGILADQVTDLGTLYRGDGADEPAEARLVSMERYYETYPETTDSEEMQHQEDRGLLAQMNDGDKWKIALYFMAAAFVFVLAWEYLPSLLSGGGGGGGGLLPF